MKNTMCFMRGMGIGLAAGMATAAAVKCVCMKSKKFRKKDHKSGKGGVRHNGRHPAASELSRGMRLQIPKPGRRHCLCPGFKSRHKTSKNQAARYAKKQPIIFILSVYKNEKLNFCRHDI